MLAGSSIVDLRVFAVRWTYFETFKEGHVMPIGIKCRDKPPDRQHAIESKGVNTSSIRNPKVCYTDMKPELRFLCGSV